MPRPHPKSIKLQSGKGQDEIIGHDPEHSKKKKKFPRRLVLVHPPESLIKKVGGGAQVSALEQVSPPQ